MVSDNHIRRINEELNQDLRKERWEALKNTTGKKEIKRWVIGNQCEKKQTLNGKYTCVKCKNKFDTFTVSPVPEQKRLCNVCVKKQVANA